ncbi:MAG TPA: tetratricopeptide repeat protein [Candidatus Hydrogenedentes bacterium]|nr:tetratricopeptide repeat protein [Candidatus Hydrogenedentota bacterium]HOS02790.1 tetratricopeptide repeat protein [Candidatus Hydrogenedentota bacterium]
MAKCFDPKQAMRFLCGVLFAAGSIAVLLAFAEGALRWAKYGYPAAYFQVDVFEGKQWVSVNDAFLLRFFPQERIFPPFPVRFTAQKPPNTFRCFVLGGSSAMGYPSPEGGFWRILKVMLQEKHPGKNIEVINCANPGVDSHMLLPIARECRRYAPDLFIVYIGNNEFLGPYGPCGPGGRFPPPLSIIRAQLAIKTTRLGQFAMGLGARLAASNAASLNPLAFQGAAPDDPRVADIYKNYARNLDDIVRAGTTSAASVVLGTAPSIFKDWPPMGSAHRNGMTLSDTQKWDKAYAAGCAEEEKGHFESALQAYEVARKIDDRFAELHFRMGNCFHAIGDFPRARSSLQRARDLELLRSNMDDRLVSITREIAARHAPRDVIFVDVPASVESQGPNGFIDHSLAYDNAHFTFDGNYWIATAFAPAIADIAERRLNGAPGRNQAFPGPEACRKALAWTTWHDWKTRKSVAESIRKAAAALRIESAAPTELSVQPLQRLLLADVPPLPAEELRHCIAAVKAYLDRVPSDGLQRSNLALMEQELAQAPPSSPGETPIPLSTQ